MGNIDGKGVFQLDDFGLIDRSGCSGVQSLDQLFNFQQVARSSVHNERVRAIIGGDLDVWTKTAAVVQKLINGIFQLSR